MKNDILEVVGMLILLAVVSAVVINIRKAPPATTTQQQEIKDVQTKKRTTITQSPTGEVKTVITERARTRSNTTSTVKVKSKDLVNVSLLAGYNFKERTGPIYGIMVSKPLLGPLTMGAFGLSNGTLGASVGVEF